MENQVDIDAVINNLAQKVTALTVENSVLQARVQTLVAQINGDNEDPDSGSDLS